MRMFYQAMGPVQVRYADGEKERHGNTSSTSVTYLACLSLASLCFVMILVDAIVTLPRNFSLQSITEY